MIEDFHSYLILWSGGIASKKPSRLLIMGDHRQCEFFKLTVAHPKIFLVVVAAWLCDLAADWAMLLLTQL